MAVPAFAGTHSEPQRWNVTFDSPPVNKVDPEMILELQALVDQIALDPDVNDVVFLAGSDAFFASAARLAA
jgi:enoyl-CoA hydratase/carnithine racemase